jgi:hypothetical protein
MGDVQKKGNRGARRVHGLEEKSGVVSCHLIRSEYEPHALSILREEWEKMRKDKKKYL